MAQGKFSNPRPHRDEERQIEQAFRQLTGQEPVKRNEPQIFDAPIPADTPAEFDTSFEKDFEAEFGKVFEEPSPEPVRPATGAYEKPRQEIPVRNYRPDPILFDEEEPEYDDRDFLDKAMAFINENKKLVLAFLCAAALLIIVLVGSIFFFGGSGSDEDGVIFDNIYIADIHVGGLTKKEAFSLVKEATSQSYPVLDMVIDLSGTELRLSAKDTAAALDVNAVVDAAYAYGRTGTDQEQERAQQMLRVQSYTIAVLPYLELDEAYILDTLTTYAEDTGSTLTQTSYGLEGDQPALDAEKFNEKNPTQTLVITLGTPGIGFDAQDVYDQVLDAYSLHQFRVEVENVESVKDPDPVDLEAIYEEFYIEPKNATVDLQTFETIPGSYGYGFDMEEAQKLVDAAQFGEEIRIPMEYIEPEILDGDMFYQDVLGSSQTSHTGSSSRNNNLKLACEAINGLVLNPGEQFSFNDTVGQRTSGKGYKEAPEVDDGEEVLGGGIAQVASTLYHSALLADMEINYRVNQDFAPDYIEDGLDVSVDWRSPDFQFTNTTGFPVQIEASASGGKVSIQILGTDERDYYVEIESVTTATDDPRTKYEDFEFDNDEGYEDGDVIQKGITGFTVKTYSYKYNKANGELISKDFIATSQYDRVDEIVARVEPEETTEPETEPETEPTPRPTAPPVVPTEPETEPTTEPTTAPTEPGETSPKAETQPEEEAVPQTTPVTQPQLSDLEAGQAEASDDEAA